MKFKDFDVKCEAIYPLYEHVKQENMMAKLGANSTDVKMSDVIKKYL